MQIREFELTDQTACIALWRVCDLIVPWNDPARDIERKLKVDPDLFLVGIKQNQLIASVMGGYDGHRGWVNYLAVHPEQQRQGYGRQIMNAVEQRIKQKGCAKINLQVRASNQSVINFYQSLGFSDDNVIGLGKRLESDE